MDVHYKKGKSAIVVRLDEGEELVTSLKLLCKKENIECAIFSGIGACKKADIARYDTKEKKYHKKTIEGMLEIVSLNGNITLKDGEPFVHAHISLGLGDFSLEGGHAVRVEINPTCEIILMQIPLDIERKFDEKSGLSLQEF